MTTEAVTFNVTSSPPEVERIAITGRRITLGGLNDFAVHQKVEGWPGNEWRVTHIPTGAWVAVGDTEEEAVSQAEFIAASHGEKFAAAVKEGQRVTRGRITYWTNKRLRGLS